MPPGGPAEIDDEGEEAYFNPDDDDVGVDIEDDVVGGAVGDPNTVMGVNFEVDDAVGVDSDGDDDNNDEDEEADEAVGKKIVGRGSAAPRDSDGDGDEVLAGIAKAEENNEGGGAAAEEDEEVGEEKEPEAEPKPKPDAAAEASDLLLAVENDEAGGVADEAPNSRGGGAGDQNTPDIGGARATSTTKRRKEPRRDPCPCPWGGLGDGGAMLEGSHGDQKVRWRTEGGERHGGGGGGGGGGVVVAGGNTNGNAIAADLFVVAFVNLLGIDSHTRIVMGSVARERTMFADEMRLRLRQAQSLPGPEDDEYSGLVGILDNLEDYSWDTEAYTKAALSAFNPADTMPSRLPLVKTLDEFKQNFNLFTAWRLEGMSWDNICVAGGAVLCSMTDLTKSRSIPISSPQQIMAAQLDEFPSSDIDIFLYGLTYEEAAKKILEIHEHLRHSCIAAKHDSVSAGRLSLSWECGAPLRKVQVVLHIYKTLSHIAASFDLDCASLLYDGCDVWGLPKAIRALNTGFNILNSHVFTIETTRIKKYQERGYQTCFPWFGLYEMSQYDVEQNLSLNHLSWRTSPSRGKKFTVFCDQDCVLHKQQLLAFSCAFHQRCGLSSPARHLSKHTALHIFQFVLPPSEPNTICTASSSEPMQSIPSLYYDDIPKRNLRVESNGTLTKAFLEYVTSTALKPPRELPISYERANSDFQFLISDKAYNHSEHLLRVTFPRKVLINVPTVSLDVGYGTLELTFRALTSPPTSIPPTSTRGCCTHHRSTAISTTSSNSNPNTTSSSSSKNNNNSSSSNRNSNNDNNQTCPLSGGTSGKNQSCLYLTCKFIPMEPDIALEEAETTSIVFMATFYNFSDSHNCLRVQLAQNAETPSASWSVNLGLLSQLVEPQPGGFLFSEPDPSNKSVSHCLMSISAMCTNSRPSGHRVSST
ncbi:Arp, Ankyrin repeat protein [Pelomyxa schiedti]|nr:Arp, Ankyrin repeat protein [Pelomyxa schiedti]